MSLTLRTDSGCTEAIIDEDCGFKRFYEVADILYDNLNVRFTNKIDDIDSLYWAFMYAGQTLVLHYHVYTGVAIYPFKGRDAHRKANNAVVDVAKVLENKLLVHQAKRYIS